MTLFEALMSKGYSSDEARQVVFEMKERVLQGEDPEELLYEEGLEPDYIMDLLM
jgi:hypothetical protein